VGCAGREVALALPPMLWEAICGICIVSHTRVCAWLCAQQMSSGMFTKKWQLRWVVLVPNGLLVFPGGGPPRTGARSKDVVVVEQGVWEGVEEAEAKRPYVLCLGQGEEVCDSPSPSSPCTIPAQAPG
jgi:hypothetical protein